jgi:cob(I)alamin adenosyltransferase
MVRLSKIYTKTGDDGSTGLGDGSRVEKSDVRVEAYGTVDEANAAVGVAVVACRDSLAAHADERVRSMLGTLLAVQNDLFDVGADLCCPIEPGEKPGSRLRVIESQTHTLETTIDQHNERLKPLDSFILPGGSPLSAAMHVARTVTRRAERCAVALLRSHPETTNPEAVRYLNRLSDLLFVLGRVANNDGADDVKWVPGAGAGGASAKS